MSHTNCISSDFVRKLLGRHKISKKEWNKIKICFSVVLGDIAMNSFHLGTVNISVSLVYIR